MGNMLVRNLDDDVIARLKHRAAERGTSLQEVARTLLTEGSKLTREQIVRRAEARAGRQRRQSEDSTAIIRAMRDGNLR
jgi:plasmid stability protein